MIVPPRTVGPEPKRSTGHEHGVCPPWCQGGHEIDDWGLELATRLLERSHQGPSFGRYISTGAEETVDGLDVPTAIVFELDGVEMNAFDLRCLAEHAAAAAQWCEANR